MGILMLFGKNLLAFYLGGHRELQKGSKISFLLYGIL